MADEEKKIEEVEEPVAEETPEPEAVEETAANRVLELALDARPGIVGQDLVEPFDQNIGAGFDLLGDVENRLPAMIEDLDYGADANRQEKCDDQCRNGASQRRLGGQEPPICRFGDRLGQSLDRIGPYRRARCLGARHCRPPFRIVPTNLHPEGCAASLRITFIGIEKRGLVESPGEKIRARNDGCERARGIGVLKLHIAPPRCGTLGDRSA